MLSQSPNDVGMLFNRWAKASRCCDTDAPFPALRPPALQVGTSAQQQDAGHRNTDKNFVAGAHIKMSKNQGHKSHQWNRKVKIVFHSSQADLRSFNGFKLSTLDPARCRVTSTTARHTPDVGWFR